MAETLELLPPDTAVIVPSDHGVKRMYYRVNTNELLAEEGFLRLREKPKRPIGLKEASEKAS